MFCHQLEELEDLVVCGVSEVFNDFVGDDVGAGGFSGSYSLAGSDAMAFCEMLVHC